MTDRNRVLARIDSDMDGMVLGLQELVRQPSVSATGEGIEKCARLVRGMLERCGIPAEILRLGDGVAPVVYGEVCSKANPEKTILFYNHYDVQPAGRPELWDDPPFSGVVKDGSVFGRGAADDKGELVTRVWAVKSFLEETGDVPCNVKFVIEGEEEIGSEHVGAYLSRYQKKFSCDGVIWEFGYVDASDRSIISLGMKGLLFAELCASGPRPRRALQPSRAYRKPGMAAGGSDLIHALRGRHDSHKGLVQGGRPPLRYRSQTAGKRAL